MRLAIWWHRFVLRHEQHWKYGLSVGFRDIGARGSLVRCACLKSWAL